MELISQKMHRLVLIVVLVLTVVVVGGFAYLYFNGMSGIANTTEAKEGQIKSPVPVTVLPMATESLVGPRITILLFCRTYWATSIMSKLRRQQLCSSGRSYRTLPHYEESLAYDADFVVFMMGSNNSKPENWKGAETCKTNLLSLLDSYLLSSWKDKRKALPSMTFSP